MRSWLLFAARPVALKTAYGPTRTSCGIIAYIGCLRTTGLVMHAASSSESDPKRTRQMIRLADGVVFDYVVPIFNMVTSTAKDSNGA